MHRQGILYGGLAILGIAILVTAGIFVYKAGQKSGTPTQPPEETGTQPTGSITREDVPLDTVVPDANSAVADGVAKPAYVMGTVPGSDISFRAFDVRIDQGRFDPESIVIYALDVARINFTAVDRDYDVVQPDTGYKFVVKKGQTKVFEGQFPNPGKFTVYCEACGGPEAGFLGYIVAVPKE